MAISIKGVVAPDGTTHHFDHEYLDNNPTIPAVVTTLTEEGEGQAADAAAVGTELSQLKSDLSDAGLSNDAKIALLNCFKNVVWATDKGQDYYDALEDALYASSKVLVSISAVFDQGQNVIYTDDSLDDLKQYLIVLAHYDDGSQSAVTGYSLNGALTEGTSVVTITYEGKTATFNVVVTKSHALYKLNSPQSFNGSSDYIDTELQLLKEDIDYTILFEAEIEDELDSEALNRNVFTAIGAIGGGSLFLRVNKDSASHGDRRTQFNIFNNAIYSVHVYDTSAVFAHVIKGYMVHEKGTNLIKTDAIYVDAVKQSRNNEDYTYNYVGSSESTLLIGAQTKTSNFFKGTVKQFAVIDYAMSDSELEEFIGG